MGLLSGSGRSQPGHAQLSRLAAAVEAGGHGVPGDAAPAARRASPGAVAARVLLHAGFLLIAIGCFAAYLHFHLEGRSTASLVSLAAAAVFGFAPVRDVLRVAFGLEGKALHLVHALGGLGLIALPVTGAVSGTPILSHAATAPFAMMGAAQAMMHQNHPRNAAQAAALQRFAASIPEVATFTSSKDLASPQNAARAVSALSDILSKAQALGQTELDSDPGFQNALRQVSTRVGAGLGLDMVQVALDRMAANPATAGAVPGLRKRLESARRSFGRGS